MKKLFATAIGFIAFTNINAQNVGIGTNTPNAKLHVEANTDIVANFSNNTGILYTYYSKNNTHIGFIGSTSGQHFDLGTTSGNSTGDLRFTIQSSPKMVIDNAGNVGIGTVNPTYPLTLAASTSGQAILVEKNSSRFGMLFDPTFATTRIFSTQEIVINASTVRSYPGDITIKTNGNVGIGIDPEFPLDVRGRARIMHSGGNTAGIWLNGSTNNITSFVGNFDDNHVGFYGHSGAGWGLLMNVDNGNTGIGTAAPAAKLEVNGYTKLGSDAPAIKVKKLTGTMNASATQVVIPHSLNLAKILAVNVLVDYATGAVPAGYTVSTDYEYYYHVTGTNIVITPVPGNSFLLLSRNIRVMITYEE